MSRPIIAVTMGDPAGVGPEIAVKAISKKEITDMARCVLIGDAEVIKHAMSYPNMPCLDINIIEKPCGGAYENGVIDVIDLNNVNMDTFKPGEIRGEYGRAAYEYIAKSIELTMGKECAAVATTPINKEALKRAMLILSGTLRYSVN